jgi:hypothetical protein
MNWEEVVNGKQRGVRLLLRALLLVTAFLSGCAVLTPSQVKEVGRFAEATQGYGTLPGAVISMYGEVAEENRLLAVTGYTFRPGDETADQALKDMKSARQRHREFNAAANQADEALQILNLYASALTILTSDDFNTSLDESATAVGKSLDKAIAAYNDSYQKDFSLIGSAAAQIVRGAGGIYLRYKQTVLLKEYVGLADPLIEALTKDVEDMIQEKVSPNLKDLMTRVEREFINSANHHGKLDLGTVVRINQIFYRLEGAESLADSAVSSAKRYREAHRALKEALGKKQDLKGVIEQITVLADEVKAARKLKEKFE